MRKLLGFAAVLIGGFALGQTFWPAIAKTFLKPRGEAAWDDSKYSDRQLRYRIDYADHPVLVMFEPRCNNSNHLESKPVFESLQKKYAGRVEIVRVDPFLHQGLAQRYSVRTNEYNDVLYDRGAEVKRINGEELIKKSLGGADSFASDADIFINLQQTIEKHFELSRL